MGQTNCACNRLPDNCKTVTVDGPCSSWTQSEGYTVHHYPRDTDVDFKYSSEPVQLETGAVYVGEWIDSFTEGGEPVKKKHGKGVLTLPENGGWYEGQFHEDMKHGVGKYSYPSGSMYDGEWVDDLQNGHGKESWPDGSVFEGYFNNGAKHGHGIFTWANKCRYEGEFDSNDMHGKGVYHWNDGRGYSGNWRQNAMSDNGEMWWSDGRRYTGQFKDGKKHGDGMLRWADGRYYHGQWLDGKQDGRGIACNVRGVKRQSEWKDGKFVAWGEEVDDSNFKQDDYQGHRQASPSRSFNENHAHQNSRVREGEAAGGPERTPDRTPDGKFRGETK